MPLNANGNAEQDYFFPLSEIITKNLLKMA